MTGGTAAWPEEGRFVYFGERYEKNRMYGILLFEFRLYTDTVKECALICGKRCVFNYGRATQCVTAITVESPNLTLSSRRWR